MTFLTTHQPLYRFARSSQYGGATLLFVLIMLLVVSIIGVAAARSTLMQERMASNTQIRNVVFEAAESALAMGETRVANTPKIWRIFDPDPNSPSKTPRKTGCIDGICAPNTLIAPEWLEATFWNNDKNYKALNDIKLDNGLVVKPKYMIEDLGQTMAVCDSNHIDITQDPDCAYTSAQRFFRVAAFANAQNTQVLLQSMYLDPNPIRTELEAPGEWTGTDNRPLCAGNRYSPSNQTCCPPDKEHPSGDWLTSSGVTACPAYCSNGEKYNPQDQMCCTDQRDGSISVTAKGACPEFCTPGSGSNAQPIPVGTGQKCCREQDGTPLVVAQTENCPVYCGGQKLEQGQSCCGLGTSNPLVYDNTKRCCNNDGLYLVPNGEQCRSFCPTANGREQYDPKTQTCCNAPPGQRGSQIVNGNKCPDYCSNGQQIDPQTQSCCGGVPVAKNAACCGSWSGVGSVYDGSSQSCCGSVVINNPQECCLDAKTEAWIGALPGNCPQYCGRGPNAVLQPPGMNSCCGNTPHNLGDSLCCSGKLYPKSEWGACPATCNGQQYDPSKKTCCSHVNGPNFLRDTGKCPVFCSDTSADNFGEEEPCKGGNRGGGGPSG